MPFNYDNNDQSGLYFTKQQYNSPEYTYLYTQQWIESLHERQ